MMDTPSYLAERLQQEGEKTLQFFQALSPDQSNRVIYATGSCWSVGQIFVHLIATEHAIHVLLQNILAGGSGSPSDFDIDAFNESAVSILQTVPVQDLVQEFLYWRAKNVSLVASLRPDDLTRRGRHPFLGVTQLSEMIKLLYRHGQIHQRDVRRALS